MPESKNTGKNCIGNKDTVFLGIAASEFCYILGFRKHRTGHYPLNYILSLSIN
jgi:hypothetical protein